MNSHFMLFMSAADHIWRRVAPVWNVSDGTMSKIRFGTALFLLLRQRGSQDTSTLDLDRHTAAQLNEASLNVLSK